MNLEEYRKQTGLRVGKFAQLLGLDPALVYLYRYNRLRPPYLRAKKIIKFSNYIIKFEDLGWTEEGELVPFTKKEVENNRRKNEF